MTEQTPRTEADALNELRIKAEREAADLRKLLEAERDRRVEDLRRCISVVEGMNKYANFQSQHDYQLITCTVEKLTADFPEIAAGS